MAKYNDDYTRINWQNYPATATPINEDNLNNMDSYLKIISERIAELSTYTPNIRIVDELPEQGVEGLLYVVEDDKTYIWDDDNDNYIVVGGNDGNSYTAGIGIDITDNVISIPQIVYRGTWYYDDTLNSKTHTFAQIYAMKDILTKENFHLFANGPADEEITCDYFNINSSVLVLQFLYGFNVGSTNKLYRIVITHLSDDTVTVGREQLLNYTGLQNGISSGTGIDITNGVISVSYDNGDTEEY